MPNLYLTGDQLLCPMQYAACFLRTDRTDRHRRQTMAHHEAMLKRWVMRWLTRRAAALNDGFVIRPPETEVARYPAGRGTQIGVWLEYALVPDRPEVQVVIEEAPILAGATP